MNIYVVKTITCSSMECNVLKLILARYGHDHVFNLQSLTNVKCVLDFFFHFKKSQLLCSSNIVSFKLSKAKLS